jgi:hypothetical protein
MSLHVTKIIICKWGEKTCDKIGLHSLFVKFETTFEESDAKQCDQVFCLLSIGAKREVKKSPNFGNSFQGLIGNQKLKYFKMLKLFYLQKRDEI